MNNNSSSVMNGSDQPDISAPTPKSQPTKMVKLEDTEKKVTFLLILLLTHFRIYQTIDIQTPKDAFEESSEPQLRDPVGFCFTFYVAVYGLVIKPEGTFCFKLKFEPLPIIRIIRILLPMSQRTNFGHDIL